MKKNKMMRAASALMVATLLTTSVISGTFAKYVTSGNASDTARVAKFGVTVTAASNTMFKTTYTKTDTQAASTITNSVASDTNVIAPGTSGELTKVTLSGTPEVAVRVTNEATVTLENWIVNTNEYYCPLEVTVGSDTLIGTSYQSTSEFKNAIEEKINAYKAEYAPGTDLSTKTDAAPVVSWKWAFDGDDAKDTALGNAATAATIKVQIKTTVTQID